MIVCTLTLREFMSAVKDLYPLIRYHQRKKLACLVATADHGRACADWTGNPRMDRMAGSKMTSAVHGTASSRQQ